ncbi:MAG: hypothetical protein C5B59_17800 [Bacteroidetes bacterium]|nr:MAG: hypothetical protein C5B59_17800 [Bacteroidota bacterium]
MTESRCGDENDRKGKPSEKYLNDRNQSNFLFLKQRFVFYQQVFSNQHANTVFQKYNTYLRCKAFVSGSHSYMKSKWQIEFF